MDNFQQVKALKPHLRFRIGAIVYLTGDLSRKCPMTVSGYLENDEYVDYSVRWPSSQNTMEIDLVSDEALTE
jgi:hypothetical protein